MSLLFPILLFALFFGGLWLATYFLLPQVLLAGIVLMQRIESAIERRPRLQQRLRPVVDRLTHLRTYASVYWIALAGALLSLFAGDGFLDLAELLRDESELVERWDRLVHEWAVYYRTPGTTLFFTAFTVLGTPVGWAVLVALVTALLIVRGDYRWAAYLVLTTSLGGVLNMALKALFKRARPDLAEALREASGFSFPSGHAMGSVIVCGALLYLALRTARRWRMRSAAIAMAISVVSAISLSRIYLGVHWISDIAAGLTAGTVWVATTTIAYEVVRRIRKIRDRASQHSALSTQD